MNMKGFTLIELLVALTIAGVLAGIALPKVAVARERAYVSSLQNDVQNANLAQEIRRSAGETLLNGIVQPGQSLPAACVGDQCYFTGSPNNTTTIDVVGSAWSVKVTSSKTSKECSFYTDGATATPPATQPNTLTCTP